MAEKENEEEKKNNFTEIWQYIKKLKEWDISADRLFYFYEKDIKFLAATAKDDGLNLVLSACKEIGLWLEKIKGNKDWYPKDIVEHYLDWKKNPQNFLPYEDELDRITHDKEYRNAWIEKHKSPGDQEKVVIDNKKWIEDRYYEEPDMFKKEDNNGK